MSVTEDAAAAASANSADTVVGQSASAGDAVSSALSTFSQPGGAFSWGGYFEALAILFLVVAVLWFALWYLKRKGGFNLLTKQGDLSIVNRLSLGPKKSLVVVRFLNKQVMLGVTDQRITMIMELPGDENNAQQDESDPPAFQARLEKAIRRNKRGG
ncbi:flagellar protein [Deltaproteobacteria bacterium]|nr:flagellar protein [Deltaproteobacteria bacterium]